MLAAVFCSAACVLSTMAIVICFSQYLVLREFNTEFVKTLQLEDTALIIQKAQMASSQIEEFTEINLESAKKLANIVNEMLTPENLAPDYPLSLTDIDPVTWEEIPEEAKTNGVSYQHIDYGYITERETAPTKAFARKFSGLYSLISS